MADKKISALTAATLPLAGTEVLPIVQSGSTVKVATDDLTVKNIRSNATSGLLQVAGPGAGTTRVMTTPNANFTAARTDAAQSFTGDQTLSTGNLVQGTAAKGFNFTANTPTAGMTSQLLKWYEEGTWTPVDTSGAALTFTSATGVYTRIGRMVFAQAAVTYPATADTSNAKIGGFPFTVANAQDARQGFISVTDESTLTNILPSPNGTDCQLLNNIGGNVINATMSGNYIYFSAVYYV